MHRYLSMLLYAVGTLLCLCGSAQADPMPDAAEQGRRLVTETGQRLPDYVGNGLNCSNCHLDAGTRTGAASWVGIWLSFPEYRARSGRMITLQDRINDCFQRSLNGRALNEHAPQMLSILAYIRWLSEGISEQQTKKNRGFGALATSLRADPIRGRQLFSERCASCHGADGQGVRSGTGYRYPPLWGSASFNDGAGMARTYTAAAFVRHNMPYGHADTLSDQEAVDVAEYFTHQPRPVFAGKASDWPRGDRPRDARN